MTGNEYQWKEHEGKMHENEGKCMRMNATQKEHEALPKHLKSTKQLLDQFPSLFRNDFHKTLETDRPPPKKSDNHIWHNNSNYSNVKDFDGSYI